MHKHFTVIKPRKGWQLIDIKEVIAYKDLLRFLVIRGIKAKYAQSVLGVGWALVQPLFTTILITFIFGNLAKLDTAGIPAPIFYAAAIVPWTYFSNCVTEASSSLVTNSQLITKVYFPRIILPISSVITKLLDFSIASVVLIAFCIFNGFYPNVYYLLIPVFVLLMMMAASGVGTLLSALAIQFRDINYAMNFLMQLLIYTVPVAYSTNEVPEEFRNLYAINPMVGIIESFRVIFTGVGEFPVTYILIGTVSTIVLLVMGTLYFKRMERIFADVA